MSRAFVLVALLAPLPAGLDRAQEVSNLACAPVAALSDTSSGRVGSLAVGPRGLLAWSEGRVLAPQVREGRGRVRSVGRAGSGPGEFESLGRMGWLGDTLWVSDFRTARVQFFSDTGAYLRGVRTPPRVIWTPRPDGSLVGVEPATVAPMPIPYAVLSFQPGSAAPDTIHRFPRVEPSPVLVPVGDRVSPNPHPFLPRTVFAQNPSGSRFCAALPESGPGTRLQCVDDRGRVVFDQILTLAPRPLTDVVYDSVIKVFSATPERTPEMMRDRISRPRNLPTVIELLVQDDGEMWLGRASRYEAQARWSRLDAAGRARSDVVLPTRHRVLRVRGDSVWLAVPDADDLETVAGCRILSGR